MIKGPLSPLLPTDHCPCLSAVHLHISLHTYFSDPSASPTTTTTNYERVIRKLRVSPQYIYTLNF